MSSSARSLCGSRRRSGSRPLAVDPLAAKVLPAGGCAQRSLPGQVYRRTARATCAGETRLPCNTRGASESEDVRRVAASAVPLRMGGLRKTPVWRCATRASLSRPIHPSRGDFQPSMVALADGMITFRWRDSAHNNKKRLMTLSVDEFLRRFLLHVLPPGFVRIRHFGLMAHR